MFGTEGPEVSEVMRRTLKAVLNTDGSSDGVPSWLRKEFCHQVKLVWSDHLPIAVSITMPRSLWAPPRGRMFVSQTTYVEKPKYMSAGRLFHSQRKYQSDETHVASTQVGHALVEGNLLPTRAVSLCKAEAEAEFVSAQRC